MNGITPSALWVTLQLVLCLPSIRAADWPAYRGPRGDGSAPGVKLPTEWPDQLATRWVRRLGIGFGSPAVAARRVYVMAQDGANETVVCLDASNGRVLWTHRYPGDFRSRIAGDGPRTTPAVDTDRVYTIGATGEMYCLKTIDGTVVWSKSFNKAFGASTPDYGFSPSPVVDGQQVIVHAGAGKGHSVVAMNKLDGRVLWRSLNDPAGYATPMILSALPQRGPRQLIVFTQLGLISLAPTDGTLYWRLPWTTAYDQNIAQPMLHGDRLVITSLTGCLAIDLKQPDNRPAFTKAWRNKNMAVHFSCPVVQDGYMYGSHGRRPQRLRCIDLADGSEKWSHRLPAMGRAGIVLADKFLLVYTDTGKLIVADASPTAYKQLAEYALAGRNWSPPVVAGASLFLRDRQSIRCVPLPKIP